MKIRYYGHSCFWLETAQGTSVITDPYQKVGYELPHGLRSDVVTVSHAHFDHAYTDGVAADVLLQKSGAYTHRDVRIEAVESFHDARQGALRGTNLIFKFYADGIKLCHLGDLGEPLSEDVLSRIGQVDVLLLPVGGTYTIDAKQARDYVEAVNPKLAVAMHYKPQDGILDIAPISNFTNLFPETRLLLCDGEVELTQESLDAFRGKICIMERKIL